MLRLAPYKLLIAAATLALGLGLGQPLWAMGGYTPDQFGTGLIQKIDYLHHSITVNGKTYAVSPSAKFSGIAAFSVLSIGMPIRFMLGDATNSKTQGPGQMPGTNSTNQAQAITAITWLPAGIQGK